ncbi:MAG: hypothetical protein R3B98_04660 [Hyphomonas sp.]
MQTANRDMFPTDATLALYPNIRCLLENPAIDQAFERHEELAVKGKRDYHMLGRLSILLIALSSVYNVAEALVLPIFPGRFYVAVVMALAAAAGIALQGYILFSQAKKRWLLNRFACERLRSLKFQAFAHAAAASSCEDLSPAVATWTSAELTRLENELNAGMSLLDTFVPAKALAPPATPAAAGPLAAEALAAYRELRISYQERFAASELHRLGENRRILNSSADLLYLSGAGLVFVSLIAKILAAQDIGRWADFLAVTSFIGGISKTVLENAALSDPSTARFERYRQDILDTAHTATDPGTLSKTIAKMEWLALEELDHFSRASKSISYRL